MEFDSGKNKQSYLRDFYKAARKVSPKRQRKVMPREELRSSGSWDVLASAEKPSAFPSEKPCGSIS